MNDKVTLRPGKPEDAQQCAAICFDAFKTISEKHNFPRDFPSTEVAADFLASLLANPGFHSVVAEIDGVVVGSNFLDERSAVAGVGPITIDPAVQDRSVGRLLMQNVLDRAQEKGFPGVRLCQATYHNRSLSLYSKLGFEVREPLSTMQGAPLNARIPGYTVRPATLQDLDACNQVCMRVHGHHRYGELLGAIQQGTATVVEHAGRITGYATAIAFFGHAVGETNESLKALIGAAPAFLGPGFLLPSRNGDLFRWCLAHGLRVVQPMTLMSVGLYNEPTGAFLPSVLY
ncbi:GNAT family N-acetyltransferase [Arenimonas donghaensis]|uniref:N-acetyltransferase domain-containing protein n=1 Tax=Arenimonas donghaensis DSM 18148 = HO3-R19 TaxID=1121014 RepID=A0A087ML20_9GAMM|nr:GNAT family N-acetyltransferase [Arenimonas donghaensis]KFL37573.1 hypothetical protein N788_09300 [Arenimonas donghaensis DSM 18148 = HO3-R19]